MGFITVYLKGVSQPSMVHLYNCISSRGKQNSQLELSEIEGFFFGFWRFQKSTLIFCFWNIPCQKKSQLLSSGIFLESPEHGDPLYITCVDSPEMVIGFVFFIGCLYALHCHIEVKWSSIVCEKAEGKQCRQIWVWPARTQAIATSRAFSNSFLPNHGGSQPNLAKTGDPRDFSSNPSFFGGWRVADS